LPAIGTGYALSRPDTMFCIYITFAALSGVGGGAFASPMSNISFFFPKKMQGLALGLNAGLGNLGVSVMQFLLPWVITFGMFGPMGGAPQQLGSDNQLWVQNAALVWVPILMFLAVLVWMLMNNLPQHDCGPTPVAIGKYLWLQMIGFLGAGVGVVLLVFARVPMPELIRIFLGVAAAVAATLLLMKFATLKTIQEPLNTVLLVLLVIVIVMTAAVGVDYSRPNIEILPDMKYTPAWEAFAANPHFPNGQTMQPPVPGTIARGEIPLYYAATKEDAVRAGEELENPMDAFHTSFRYPSF
jgi:hypothetical protein